MEQVFERQQISAASLPPRLKEKWSASVLSEGFVPFPKKLLRCMHTLFSGPAAITELAALLAIVDYRRPNLTRNPSKRFLAFLAGLPEDRFDAALAGLEGKGYITVGGTADNLEIGLDGLLKRIGAETDE